MTSLVDRFLALGKESPERIRAIRALQAFALDDRRQQNQILAELEKSDGPAIAMAFLEVSLYARNLRGAERIARLLAAPFPSTEGSILRARGVGPSRPGPRPLEGGEERLSRRSPPFDPWTSLEYRALFSSLSFLPVSRPELSAIRDGLAALDPGAVPRVDNPAVFIDSHYDVHPLLRMYLMALVSARMGDVDRAEQYAGEIAQQKFPIGYRSLAADFSRSVRAQVDRVQRKPAEALETLEPLLAGRRTRWSHRSFRKRTNVSPEPSSFTSSVDIRSPRVVRSPRRVFRLRIRVPAPFPVAARRGPQSSGRFEEAVEELQGVHRSLEGLRSGASSDGRPCPAEARGGSVEARR